MPSVYGAVPGLFASTTEIPSEIASKMPESSQNEPTLAQIAAGTTTQTETIDTTASTTAVPLSQASDVPSVYGAVPGLFASGTGLGAPGVAAPQSEPSIAEVAGAGGSVPLAQAGGVPSAAAGGSVPLAQAGEVPSVYGAVPGLFASGTGLGAGVEAPSATEPSLADLAAAAPGTVPSRIGQQALQWD